jgi:hypothetical protein
MENAHEEGVHLCVALGLQENLAVCRPLSKIPNFLCRQTGLQSAWSAFGMPPSRLSLECRH